MTYIQTSTYTRLSRHESDADAKTASWDAVFYMLMAMVGASALCIVKIAFVDVREMLHARRDRNREWL